jgi:hypothetical protein
MAGLIRVLLAVPRVFLRERLSHGIVIVAENLFFVGNVRGPVPGAKNSSASC